MLGCSRGAIEFAHALWRNAVFHLTTYIHILVLICLDIPGTGKTVRYPGMLSGPDPGNRRDMSVGDLNDTVVRGRC